MLKKLLFMGCLLGILTSLNAQTTETFETETNGSTSFTDNGQVFNITSQAQGPFKIQGSFPGTGWNGTATDNKYIDNDGFVTTLPVQFTISSSGAVPFKLKSMWLYLSNAAANVNVTGSVTIVGKLAGVTKYTTTASSGFNTSLAVSNGFSLINLSTFGGTNNSNTTIDQIVISTGGQFFYVALDAFTWSTVPNITATTSQTNLACNNVCNGSATVTPSGGISPYTYSWSPSGGISATASSLCAGIYTCTITDNASNSITKSITITQPAAITATTSQTNIACNSGTTGVASVTVSGGTPSYSYSWSPSGGTAATATGLSAGTYVCTITDANGCQITKSFTITQPTAISVNAASQTNIACNGGATGVASVTVSGGTPSYSYSWSPSGGTAATGTGLSAGTYVCTVTDANGCTKTKSFTITQPAAITATTSQTNIACNGGTTGVASVTVSGGTPSYSYSWAPSGGTAATATGLSAGTYVCTITDANGCQITKSFTITQPAAINTTVTLSSGVLTASQTGATYQWYNCSNNSPVGTNSNTFTPTQSGNYKVDITVGSCTVTSTCLTVNTLGIDDFEKNNKFVIYPNPASNIVYINSDIDGNIQIVNQLGQTVKTSRVKANEINTLNIENLTDGVYFVKISNQTKSHKLIIKK